MNNDMITFIVGCAAAVAVVAIIAGAIYNGTTNASERYYVAMHRCIDNKGSWVPSTSGGVCISNDTRTH